MDKKDIKSICVSETKLDAAFWLVIACAFGMVLGGLVYDLRRKRHLEQVLPKYSFERQTTGKDLSKRLRSVDADHMRQLTTASGLSSQRQARTHARTHAHKLEGMPV